MAILASDGTPDGSFANNAAVGIQSLHNNSSPGDIITMPNGTRSWKVKLIITKPIILQGPGVNLCTVQYDVPSGGLLQLKMVQGHRGAPSDFTGQPGIRITGINFVKGTGPNIGDNATPSDPYLSAGAINISGRDQRTDSMFRIDNCNFTNIASIVFDTVTGLVDHCNITNTGPFFYPKNSWWQTQSAPTTSYSNPVCRWADGSRADGIRWGSAEFVYVENCTLSTPGLHGGITDMFGGARMVFRNNLIIDGVITSHGTEGSGGSRAGGFRALEVYGNSFRCDDTGSNNSLTTIVCRSGVHTVYNNTNIVGTGGHVYTNNRIGLKIYRSYNGNPFTWGSATGINDMDKNSGPYASGLPDLSGTATTQSGTTAASHMTIGSLSFVDTLKVPLPWAANLFKGYVVLNRGAVTNGRLGGFASGQQQYGTIVTSTASTTGVGCLFTFVTPFNFGGLLGVDWKSGETFEINRVEHAIDSPGWGQGDILDSGHNPGVVPGAAGTAGTWVGNGQNQVNERSYAWGGSNPAHSWGVDATSEVIIKVGPGDAGDAATPGVQRPGYIAMNVHPLAGGVVGPSIIDLSTTFSTDATSQTFTIRTSGFTHPAGVTFTKTVTEPQGAPAGQMPANVTLSNAGVLSGTAVGAFAGNYILHLTATNVADSETATADFVLTISSPHVGPQISWQSPADGTIYTAGTDIPLFAFPTPGDSGLDRVEYYRGGSTLIATAVAPGPYNVIFPAAAAGTYSLTAKVYDTFNPVATATTSPAISITVVPPSSTLPPPTIVVTG